MKKTLIAIHTIMRTKEPGKPATDKSKAVPPVTQTIKPGTTFIVDSEEARDLLASGAARVKPADTDADEVVDATSGSATDKPKRGRPAKPKADGEGSGGSTPVPSGKAGETTTTGKTTEGGDGSEMV